MLKLGEGESCHANIPFLPVESEASLELATQSTKELVILANGLWMCGMAFLRELSSSFAELWKIVRVAIV